MQATKLRLAFAIFLIAISTFGACAASVTWANEQNRHSGQLSFVFHERLQLTKSPSRMSSSLLVPNRYPFLNALEIFKNNHRTGAFGFGNKFFAYAMIFVASEITFIPPDFTESASGTFGSNLVQNTTTLRIALPNLFDFGPGEYFPCGIGSKVDNTQVYAQGVFNFNGGSFRQINSAEQEELSLTENQISLPFNSFSKSFLVGPADERHSMSTFKTPNTNLGQTFEAQHSLVIANRRTRLESRTFGFVPFETLNSFGYGTHRHLSGQSKLLSDAIITKMMNAYLSKHFGVKSTSSSKGGSFIESFHSEQKIDFLLIGW